jgi:hypothetical protein
MNGCFGLILIILLFALFDKIAKNSPFLFIPIGALAVCCIFAFRQELIKHKKMLDSMTPSELEEYNLFQEYGPTNQHLVCPHCQTTGCVRNKTMMRSTITTTNSIAKIKATSHKNVTQLHCDKCQTTWDI